VETSKNIVTIRFNEHPVVGREIEYIKEVISARRLSGNGKFTKRCHHLLQELTGAEKVLLTTSCTAALEMSALLIDLQPGDEIIMPSFTFVSTAHAFVLRGALPVFVDIDADTLNVNPDLVSKAVTSRTRAIVPVHYAGVPCNMDAILEIANKNKLYVIEDAAQGLLSADREGPLGSRGDLAALSFHDTKNVVSGEGGALLINNDKFLERAEVIWEKGTNRAKFFRGEIDKYTWVDIGSSYLPSELQAAFLCAQLEKASEITAERMRAWMRYQENLQPLENQGLISLPEIPNGIRHNAHIFYILVKSEKEQSRIINGLKEQEINAVFHYQALHSSPAGKKFGRSQGDLPVTDDLSVRLIRLPLFSGLTNDQVDLVSEQLERLIRHEE